MSYALSLNYSLFDFLRRTTSIRIFPCQSKWCISRWPVWLTAPSGRPSWKDTSAFVSRRSRKEKGSTQTFPSSSHCAWLRSRKEVCICMYLYSVLVVSTTGFNISLARELFLPQAWRSKVSIASMATSAALTSWSKHSRKVLAPHFGIIFVVRLFA